MATPRAYVACCLRLTWPYRHVPLAQNVSIFDLLDTSLVHGWIVDPELDGPEAAAVVGGRSYNELLELIITSLDSHERATAAAAAAAAGSVTAAAGPTGALGGGAGGEAA